MPHSLGSPSEHIKDVLGFYPSPVFSLSMGHTSKSPSRTAAIPKREAGKMPARRNALSCLKAASHPSRTSWTQHPLFSTHKTSWQAKGKHKTFHHKQRSWQRNAKMEGLLQGQKSLNCEERKIPDKTWPNQNWLWSTICNLFLFFSPLRWFSFWFHDTDRARGCLWLFLLRM